MLFFAASVPLFESCASRLLEAAPAVEVSARSVPDSDVVHCLSAEGVYPDFVSSTLVMNMVPHHVADQPGCVHMYVQVLVFCWYDLTSLLCHTFAAALLDTASTEVTKSSQTLEGVA